MPLRALFLLWIVLWPAAAAGGAPALSDELARIDRTAADPDRKGVLVSVLAGELKLHRNRLILLRKQSGLAYSRIFTAECEKSGRTQEQILEAARRVNREVERRLGESSTGGAAPGGGARPVLSLTTAADHNSAGTFYSVLPEVGVETARASFVLSVPYYRTLDAAGGLGDVFATASLHGRAARLDLQPFLTLGFPTGQKSKGLGAGRVTFDAGITVAKSLERVRPFLTAGFTNSIFNNVGYQRPYIARGNAGHVSGGVEFRVLSRIVLGATGFAVRPLDEQAVVGRMAAGAAMRPVSGHMGMSQLPSGASATLPAAELQDNGASVWASVRLLDGVFLNVGAARSIPFRLTTVRLGLGFDVLRLARYR